MTSLVTVTDRPHGLSIQERQDFREKDYQYQQEDEGVLFPYGKYIHLIMKETGVTVDNSTVKFGVIDNHITWKGAIHKFFGVLSVSSNLHIYPEARFFCIRTDVEVKSTLMRIDDVPDLEARKYLMKPFAATSE